MSGSNGSERSTRFPGELLLESYGWSRLVNLVDLQRFAIASRCAERIQKTFARASQFLFQPRSAIAIAASPPHRAVLVAALAPVVRILHFREIKIFFPVRPFFLQRSRTVADFYPAYCLVGADSRRTHVAQIFSFSDRSAAETLILNCAQQVPFATGLYAGSHKITNRNLPSSLLSSETRHRLPQRREHASSLHDRVQTVQLGSRSDEHLVLRHRPPPLAAAAVFAAASSKKVFNSRRDSLNHAGELPKRRHDGFLHHI
jgi:hypothetical protein